MNKKDIVSRATDLLRENNVRKPVKIKKHVFTVTDADGNSANFSVKRGDKQVLYSADDVRRILDACVEIVLDAMRHGESISVKELGTLAPHLRAARRVHRPDTGEICEIPEHYVPRFLSSPELKTAVKVYGLTMSEIEASKKLHSVDGIDTESAFDDEPDLQW